MRNWTIGGRLSAAAISILALGTLAVGVTPASAAMSDGYVRGYDTYVGDWGDEGEFGHGVYWYPYNSTNAVCLWQKILWAEGAEESDHSTFDQADIDGHFGANTQYATETLQARWRLDHDGVVGPLTFGRADDNLRYVSGSDDRGEVLNLTYRGRDWSFSARRDSSGIYSFYDGNGTRRNAGYDYNSCD
ncbi:peptidoglycan-binding domain-containing protein [Streptomyces sporangiiformans]|uniref:Tat pathway signal protein n=1 Tax=Streptomyces sporangiiformans TaxID=2315329 RepID=A0A505DFJ6_9ACTN|nr:Tat pathway signal protein [Streptomyces sporangiiformans]TPQ16659.1 Tat pathway signal protein [Streptomyces sporangiiformans]